MRRGIQPGYQIPKSKCEPCLNLNNTRAWWQASGEKLVNQTMPMLCKCKVLNKLYEKEHLRNVYMKKTGVTVKNEHTHKKTTLAQQSYTSSFMSHLEQSQSHSQHLQYTQKIFREHSEQDVRILVNILR